MVTPVCVQLAEAVTACRSPLPDATTEAARLALLDWCGAAVGGGVAPPAQALMRALANHAGVQLAGMKETASSPIAALINGTAAHTLEFDDIYSPGTYHPGAPSIAAALATAAHVRANGSDLLRAIIAGYEIGNRVARTLGPRHYERWHTTGTAGSIAAAAAAAEVLELDVPSFASALALAATSAAGLQQTFRSDSMGKPFHSGHAAQMGVVAALAAREGFTGPLDVLEGEIGMGVAMSDGPSWTTVVTPFADEWTITRTTVKPYPCCGHTFAAIDAAIGLREDGLDTDGIGRIEVATYAAATDVAGILSPSTDFEAKFSIPYVVCRALQHGAITAKDFDERARTDPITRDLVARVTLVSDPEMTGAFPEHRGARVTVSTRRGDSLSRMVPDRSGDPANPLSPEVLAAKTRSLIEPVLGEVRASDLLGQLRDPGAIDDVRQLRIGIGH